MLARVIDLLALQNWMFLSANREPDTDPPEMPTMYPLPDGLEVKKPRRNEQPGSFGFIAKTLLAKAKARKEAANDA